MSNSWFIGISFSIGVFGLCLGKTCGRIKWIAVVAWYGSGKRQHLYWGWFERWRKKEPLE